MGCDFRGRWLWVLGPVFLGPVPVLLVFGFVLSFFSAGLFSRFFSLFWLFAFWTGSMPTGFLPVDLDPRSVSGGFAGLSGPDRRQRRFSALAF